MLEDKIKFIEKEMLISRSFLSSLLGTSERKVNELITVADITDKIYNRIEILHKIISLFSKTEINKSLYISMLNEPVEDENDLALLDHIIQNSEDQVIQDKSEKMIKEFEDLK